MGKLSDYASEKAKGAAHMAGKYVGMDLIKGFGKLGLDTLSETKRVLRGGTDADSTEMDIKNSVDVDTKDVEQWLDKKSAKPTIRIAQNEGEAYLRLRESLGLNLQEIDKYYSNLSWMCLFFMVLITYCFGYPIYKMLQGIMELGWITYGVTGIIFIIMYLNFAINAASLLRRRRMSLKDYLGDSGVWFPRFKLPYDWRIKD